MLRRSLFGSIAATLLFSNLIWAQDEGIAEAVAQPTPGKLPQNIAEQEPAAQPKLRPITVSVSLSDDTTVITGTLTETNTISIKTAFGLAELPLGEVAGVRFPRGDDTATTVVMLNGDSITGATDLKFANVETSWGNAKINGQSISSMLMVPGLAWQSTDVLGSKRWQLVEAPRAPLPGATGQSGSVTPASQIQLGNRPNNSNVVPATGVRVVPGSTQPIRQ